MWIKEYVDPPSLLFVGRQMKAGVVAQLARLWGMGNYQEMTQFHSLEEVECIEEDIIKHVGN